jgi:hypothetical protein
MSKSTKSLAELLRLPPPAPNPTGRPDCGSRALLPICYGSPGPEMQDEARRNYSRWMYYAKRELVLQRLLQ